MMKLHKRCVTRIIIDVSCLVLVYLPYLLLTFLATPYKRGFFCDDDSIKYSYKDNTVPYFLVLVVGGLLVLISVFVLEGLQYLRLKSTVPITDLDAVKVNPKFSFVSAVYRLLYSFLFGLALLESLINISKYTSGSLRPHFLDVCQPNYTSLACFKGADGTPSYITDDVCTTNNTSRLKDSRMSFPSGHSCAAFYIAVYLIIYFEAKFLFKGLKFFRHLLEAVLVYVAVYVSLSRIVDHKHHWYDVLCGGLTGIVLGYLTAVYIAKVFKKHSHWSGDNFFALSNFSSSQSSSMVLNINAQPSYNS